ncbi:MAG: urea ABC transporter permease subunit UrtC [Mameliella sp.]|nr:urea ABC transporter permease subunit UrtC [Mameliella sp.]|tara:strand:+ start:5079 stop:6179 length:1101 start_codon:yes stop_codon:yes gene_type:complete
MTQNPYHNKKLQWLAYALVFGLLGIVPFITSDDFLLNQLATYGIYGLLAVSISLCWGSGGILNLGQGIAFALGAYGMAMTMQMQSQAPGTIPPFMANNGLADLPFYWEPFRNTAVGLGLALFIPTLFYLIFGWLMFVARVSGPFFAIMTLAILSALGTVFVALQPYTNGVNGISPPGSLMIGSFEIDPYSSTAYWIVFGLLLLFTFAAKLLTQSRFGLVVRALKDDPERVRFLGYNVAIYETFVYAASGLMAAAAGASFVMLTQYVSPAQFDVGFSISAVIWAAIGGRNSLLWAMIGAFMVQGAQSYAGDVFLDTWILILGFFFILVVRFLPNGFSGLVETIMGQLFSSRKDDHILGATPAEGVVK